MEKKEQKKQFEHVSVKVVNVKKQSLVCSDCGFTQNDADNCDGVTQTVFKPIL